MSHLNIFNSLSQKKSQLKTVVPGHVKMYVCGMTVYDHCHIGHARVLVFFDTFVKILEWLGYEVEYVRNVTDVDDKIIKKAIESNKSSKEVSDFYMNAMLEDEHSLGVKKPHHLPRATEYISEMIEMIQVLMDKGHAYQTESGDVCFSVESNPQYGQLANQKLDQLIHGQRVASDAGKKHPMDFVLWKPSKPNEPSWPSPFGQGRPGWHIECSAMATSVLGQTLDIHGGGLDLKFPHHENEIAQSECAIGHSYVNHWMHVGHVQINKEKMSKSLGNFITIRDMLKHHHSETLRYFILSSHYRSPLAYSMAKLDQAKQALSKLYISIKGLDQVQLDFKSENSDEFKSFMEDDINIPGAISVLFKLAKTINQCKLNNDTSLASKYAGELKTLGGLLGLLQVNPDEYLQGDVSIDVKFVEEQIAHRNQARLDKDYALADQIRSELAALGIELEDQQGKTTWRSVL